MSAAAVPEWEYLIKVETPKGMQLWELDELGEEGWQLCSTVSTITHEDSSNWPACTKFYFKRQIKT